MAISEAEQIEQVLRQLDFPDEVVDWDVELGSDWTDDPAVWVTLVIDDDVWTDEWLQAVGLSLPPLVKSAIRNAGMTRWPYLRILTASDYEEVRASELNR